MAKYCFTIILVLLSIACKVVADEPEAKLLRGNPIAGKTKSETCIACHGLDGNSMTPIWPKIAGLANEYLLQQLLDFQQGEKGPRYDPTMYGLVQGLNP